MTTTDNGNKNAPLEKIAPATNQPPVSPGAVSADNYCPPAQPADKKNTKANKAYDEKMLTCANHLLREVRVEMQEIVRVLDEHLAGNLDIKSHQTELDSSKVDIDNKIADLKNNYLCHMAPVDFYSEIFNLWQMVQGSPYFVQTKRDELLDPSKSEQDRLREINLLKNRLSRLTFLIEYSTGIERINSWIQGARPGYALPFHSIFEDEMKSAEDRQKMLNLFSLQPESILGGLIDPVKGVILCYPQTPADRALRHVMNLLFFVLSFFLVYQIGTMLSGPSNIGTLLGIDLSGTGKPDANFLLLSWTAMLVGIGGHVLVTGAKVSNVEFRQFPLPLRDWEFYLSARTTMILYKTTLALFVFLSMFVMLKGEIALMDAFLIGYSFDSVVELVGVSLEKRSAGSVNSTKEKLGAAG